MSGVVSAILRPSHPRKRTPCVNSSVEHIKPVPILRWARTTNLMRTLTGNPHRSYRGYWKRACGLTSRSDQRPPDDVLLLAPASGRSGPPQTFAPRRGRSRARVATQGNWQRVRSHSIQETETITACSGPVVQPAASPLARRAFFSSAQTAEIRGDEETRAGISHDRRRPAGGSSFRSAEGCERGSTSPAEGLGGDTGRRGR